MSKNDAVAAALGTVWASVWPPRGTGQRRGRTDADRSCWGGNTAPQRFGDSYRWPDGGWTHSG
jgi:hypothetical protein